MGHFNFEESQVVLQNLRSEQKTFQFILLIQIIVSMLVITNFVSLLSYLFSVHIAVVIF